MSSNHPLVLLTNDDGFDSQGLSALFHQMKDWGQTYIVAPDQEKSASSLSLTLRHPLRVKSIQHNIYAVDGTPADCVYLAVQKLLPRYPDLLISGLNHGPNLGQQDISYSGTVAGALQGAFLNIPSMAASVMPDGDGNFFFDYAAKIVHALAKKILEHSLPPRIALNINIPSLPIKGLKLATLGEKRYNPRVIEKKDPRGKHYYWIGAGNPQDIGGTDSDVMVVKDGYIAVTPLHKDLTDPASIQSPVLKEILASLQHEIL
ncbi:MAG: 5'/3'-nucleotidase SurE [Candidatus Aminicenantes bacterium]|nr:5'/3'-nucleotidase SurE [Candidatus Aminicenantes bacterium]MDH5384924.1 5'/3'-nucleotidase SurE [Candidatus Aminicenantes bacterium]MDH5743202.1 5'/3'-nucleotidase SurE [Candidatus Aminicenantes bacterium]